MARRGDAAGATWMVDIPGRRVPRVPRGWCHVDMRWKRLAGCDAVFTVKGPDGEDYGKVVKEAPDDFEELVKQGLTDADIFTMSVPKDAPNELKAAMMTSLLLMDCAAPRVSFSARDRGVVYAVVPSGTGRGAAAGRHADIPRGRIVSELRGAAAGPRERAARRHMPQTSADRRRHADAAAASWTLPRRRVAAAPSWTLPRRRVAATSRTQARTRAAGSTRTATRTGPTSSPTTSRRGTSTRRSGSRSARRPSGIGWALLWPSETTPAPPRKRSRVFQRAWVVAGGEIRKAGYSLKNLTDGVNFWERDAQYFYDQLQGARGLLFLTVAKVAFITAGGD